jgi:hypothetical protein
VDETISVESPNNMVSKSSSEGENDDDFLEALSQICDGLNIPTIIVWAGILIFLDLL